MYATRRAKIIERREIDSRTSSGAAISYTVQSNRIQQNKNTIVQNREKNLDKCRLSYGAPREERAGQDRKDEEGMEAAACSAADKSRGRRTEQRGNGKGSRNGKAEARRNRICRRSLRDTREEQDRMPQVSVSSSVCLGVCLCLVVCSQSQQRP